MTTPTQHAAPWEPVPFISNYFDGPIEGVAHFQGQPHLFFRSDEISRRIPATEGQEGDEDDFTFDLVFNLYPIPAPVLADFYEKNAIFERWHHAWSNGLATIKEHPALPADRARYETLQARIKPWIEARRDATPVHVRIGNFAGNRHPVAPGASRWMSFEVQWSQAPSPVQG